MRYIHLFLLLFLTVLHLESQEIVSHRYININPSDEFNSLQNRSTSFDLAFDGNLKGLSLKETDIIIYKPGEKHWDVKTYDVIQNNTFIGTYTWSPNGVWYHLYPKGEAIYIYPEREKGKDIHRIAYGNEDHNPIVCGVKDNDIKDVVNEGNKENSLRSFGSTIYTYTLALVTTGEFYEFNGNNDTDVRAVVASTVSGLVALYQRELSVRFTLPSSNLMLYKNSNTDPFIPDTNNDDRVDQATSVINSDFPNANSYDIGHVLHRTADDGDDWGSGGLAYVNAVCNDNLKAGGWSGSYTNQGFSWISLIGHEFGHMFGAKHSYSGSGENCGSINYPTSWEIGSGTTIMSYNGLCDDDNNIPPSGAADNYFHIGSLLQMISHIETTDCAAEIASNNAIPEIDASPCGVGSYTIPLSTPFYLEGTATDDDVEDELLYSWEQVDIATSTTRGRVGTSAGSCSTCPIFRSYPPTSDNFRHFPALFIQNSDGVDDFDVLSSVQRIINFKLTVRDMHTDGTAIDEDDLQVVVSSTGPLTVTQPTTWNSGDDVDIVWNANGSEALCDNVDILLSLDGGENYLYTLGEDVPYSDQTFSYNVSGLFVSSTQAKIKVQCADYDCFTFYDTSNDFDLVSSCDAEGNYLCPSVDQSYDFGDAALNMTAQSIIIGEDREKISYNPTQSNNTDHTLVFYGENGVGCTDLFNFTSSQHTIQVTNDGDYTFTLEERNGFISILDLDSYDINNPCTSFLGSTVESLGGNSISFNFNVTVNLEACTDYLILFFPRNDFDEDVVLESITGPGVAITESTTDPEKYYIAVDQETQVIRFITEDPDFRTLGKGVYDIYGVTIGNDDTDINDYLDQVYNQFFDEGDCLISSGNSFELEIIRDCALLSATSTEQSACIPTSGKYTQSIEITYIDVVAGSTISAGGQLFDITTSPQTIVLELNADGEDEVITVFLSSETECTVDVIITHPESCCTFDVDLGADLVICPGKTIALDAGDGGLTGSYQWYQDEVILSETGSILDVTAGGIYSVIVTNETGCFRSDEIILDETELPTLEILGPEMLCIGTTEIYTAETNSTSIRWYLDDVLLQEGEGTSLSLDEGGVLRVEVGESSDCQVEKEITIVGNESPVVDFEETLSSCEGETLILRAGEDGTRYIWSQDDTVLPAETMSTLSVTSAGTYGVVVENSLGCTTMDEVVVSFVSSPSVTLPGETKFCEGQESILTADSDATSFKWFKDNVLIEGETGNEITVTETGTYSVIGALGENCTSVAFSEVISVPVPVLELEETMTGCQGDEVILEGPTGDLTYSWLMDGTEVGSMKDHTVTESGVYTLIVTNEADCSDEDDIMVTFFEYPTLTIINDDDQLCEGDLFTFEIETDGDDIKWYIDDVELFGETSDQLEVGNSGNFRVEVSNASGCIAKQDFSIEVVEKPIIDLGEDIVGCNGMMVMLSANMEGLSYEWRFGGNIIGTTEEIEVEEPGDYTLNVKNSSECSNFDVVNVSFSSPPTLSIPEMGTLCDGQNVSITAITSGDTFVWYKDGEIISNETTESLTIDSDGIYTIDAKIGQGCTTSDTITISSSDSPIVDLGEDMMICPEESITLDAGNPGNTYIWSTGSDMQMIEILHGNVNIPITRTYSVEVTNEANCSTTSQVMIDFIPVARAVIDAEQDYVCIGDSLRIDGSGVGSLEWTGPEGTYEDLGNGSIVVYPSEESIYELSATSICPDDVGLNIINISSVVPADMSAGPDTCALTGTTIELNAMGGNRYLWEDDMSIVSDIDESTIEVRPTTETIYSVTITDDNGCIVEDMITVCVIEDATDLIKPISVITPNGDNKNDQLIFDNLELYGENHLQIFNRWGDLVFEAYNYQIVGLLFDGTTGGDNLAADTYYYVLTFSNQKIKNTLTIVREN